MAQAATDDWQWSLYKKNLVALRPRVKVAKEQC